MQKGSLKRRVRYGRSDVWEFRWLEPGPNGARRHRRIVVGSIDQIDKAGQRLRLDVLGDENLEAEHSLGL